MRVNTARARAKTRPPVRHREVFGMSNGMAIVVGITLAFLAFDLYLT